MLYKPQEARTKSTYQIPSIVKLITSYVLKIFKVRPSSYLLMSLARRSTCSNTWPMFSNKLSSKYCLTGKTHRPSENTKIWMSLPRPLQLVFFFYPILNGNAFSYSRLIKRLCCHRNTKIKVVKILVPEWRKMDHHLSYTVFCIFKVKDFIFRKCRLTQLSLFD